MFECRESAYRVLNLVKLLGLIGFSFKIDDFEEIRGDRIISTKDMEAKVRELLVKFKKNKLKTLECKLQKSLESSI